jgi:hypothetical protein
VKYTKLVKMEFDVDAIRIDVWVRYGEDREDLKGQGFPFLQDDRIQLSLDLASKKVRDWPEGKTAYVHTKVCDEGSYYLLVGDEIVAEIVNNYVPDVMPGDHDGDYLILDILADGTVNEWDPRERDLRGFGGDK